MGDYFWIIVFKIFLIIFIVINGANILKFSRVDADWHRAGLLNLAVEVFTRTIISSPGEMSHVTGRVFIINTTTAFAVLLQTFQNSWRHYTSFWQEW